MVSAAARTGHPLVPGCPLLVLTGVACPLCGGLQATAALGSGRLLDALDANALAVLAIVAAVAGWLRWTARRAAGRAVAYAEPSPRLLAASAAVLLAWTVLRNTTTGAWFAP